MSNFTKRWFRRRLQPPFTEYVAPRFRDKPCHYLEIGTWEGMGMNWMFTYALTHPGSGAHCVDPWAAMQKHDAAEMEAVYQRAMENLASYVTEGRLRIWRKPSSVALPLIYGMYKSNFDLILVDGDHSAPAVAKDAEWAYKLARPGAWIVFDDVNNKRLYQDHVKHGIAAWLETGPTVKLVWETFFVQCYEKAA